MVVCAYCKAEVAARGGLCPSCGEPITEDSVETALPEAPPEPGPVATTTRLTCRHCGAFVDPTASPNCPVCLETTEGAVPVPWTPPADEEDAEARPLQVSATHLPDTVLVATSMAMAEGIAAAASALADGKTEVPRRATVTPGEPKEPISRETPFRTGPRISTAELTPAPDSGPPLELAEKAEKAGGKPEGAPPSREVPLWEEPASPRTWGLTPIAVIVLVVLVVVSFAAGAGVVLILRPACSTCPPAVTAR